MKINPITTSIAVGISALMAYGFYSFNDNALRMLLGIGSFITFALTLFFVLGVRFDFYAQNINTRYASTLFFTAFLVSHLLFSFLTFTQGLYVVVHGILLLLYLLVLYYLARPMA
ncbi:MAG: hypothetical protein V4581_17960 [Bacteroidota bacterium]